MLHSQFVTVLPVPSSQFPSRTQVAGKCAGARAVSTPPFSRQTRPYLQVINGMHASIRERLQRE